MGQHSLERQMVSLAGIRGIPSKTFPGFPPPQDHVSWKRSSSYSMSKKCRSSPHHGVGLAKDVKTEDKCCCGPPVAVPSAFPMLYTKLVLFGKVSLLGPLIRALVSILSNHW